MLRTNRPRAFTLVELLVVIGIIALLIGILVPVLGKAREAANAIKCAANLRSIGQGFLIYEATFKGTLPPSVVFYGMHLDNASPPNQTPNKPVQGYIHWSSLITNAGLDLGDPKFLATTGWEQFQCPSLDKGGVPPANTYTANQESGFTNDTTTAGIVDLQAPRLAYAANEALCPRGRLGLGVSGTLYSTPYHYVKGSAVSNSAEVVLATELWGVQALESTTAQAGGAGPVSNSRRGLSGFAEGTSGAPSMDKAYAATDTSKFVAGTVSDLVPDPSTNQSWVSASNIPSTLNFAGRNHGSKRLGTVASASGSIGGWDLRNTNFLYLDGHVETKNIAQTLYPANQWGAKFYSLTN